MSNSSQIKRRKMDDKACKARKKLDFNEISVLNPWKDTENFCDDTSKKVKHDDKIIPKKISNTKNELKNLPDVNQTSASTKNNSQSTQRLLRKKISLQDRATSVDHPETPTHRYKKRATITAHIDSTTSEDEIPRAVKKTSKIKKSTVFNINEEKENIYKKGKKIIKHSESREITGAHKKTTLVKPAIKQKRLAILKNTTAVGNTVHNDFKLENQIVKDITVETGNVKKLLSKKVVKNVDPESSDNFQNKRSDNATDTMAIKGRNNKNFNPQCVDKSHQIQAAKERVVSRKNDGTDGSEKKSVTVQVSRHQKKKEEKVARAIGRLSIHFVRAAKEMGYIERSSSDDSFSDNSSSSEHETSCSCSSCLDSSYYLGSSCSCSSCCTSDDFASSSSSPTSSENDE